MTDQPTGRALAEAAARAMGWFVVPWVGGQGWMRPGGNIPAIDPEPTEREMLAWLHARGQHGAQVFTTSTSSAVECELVLGDHSEEMGQTFYYGPAEATTCGPTMRDALMRLVVAVAKREATNG